MPIEDSRSSIVYKNIFCAICNYNKLAFKKYMNSSSEWYHYSSGFKKIMRDTPMSSTINKDDRKVVQNAMLGKIPFEIYITCRYFLDVSNHVTLNSLVEMSHDKAKCSIRFYPYSTVEYCEDYRFDVGKCNITGRWPIYDPDIEHACEKKDSFDVSELSNKHLTFKNPYCEMCNPSFLNNTVIDKCNVTGLWAAYDVDTERACHIFPVIYAMSPFKNYFCSLCNGHRLWRNNTSQPPGSGGSGHGGSGGGSGVGGGGSVITMPTLRSLFSLLEYDDVSIDDKGEQCRAGQLYDQPMVCDRFISILDSHTANSIKLIIQSL